MNIPDDENWTPCDRRHGHIIINAQDEIVTTPILFDSVDPEDHQYAKTRFCDHCPFVEWCNTQAMAAWDTAHYKTNTQYSGPVGTWAGKLIRPRKGGAPEGMPQPPRVVNRPSRATLGPVECGTRRGYDKHRRDNPGVPVTCTPCRIASNESRARRRTPHGDAA